MNWFIIAFTHKQIQQRLDINFANEFNVIFDRLNRPEGLALFRDNHKLNHYQYYYLRIPEIFPFDPLTIFSHNGNVNRTFPPDVMMLELIEGNH